MACRRRSADAVLRGAYGGSPVALPDAGAISRARRSTTSRRQNELRSWPTATSSLRRRSKKRSGSRRSRRGRRGNLSSSATGLRKRAWSTMESQGCSCRIEMSTACSRRSPSSPATKGCDFGLVAQGSAGSTSVTFTPTSSRAITRSLWMPRGEAVYSPPVPNYPTEGGATRSARCGPQSMPLRCWDGIRASFRSGPVLCPMTSIRSQAEDAEARAWI